MEWQERDCAKDVRNQEKKEALLREVEVSVPLTSTPYRPYRTAYSVPSYLAA